MSVGPFPSSAGANEEEKKDFFLDSACEWFKKKLQRANDAERERLFPTGTLTLRSVPRTLLTFLESARVLMNKRKGHLFFDTSKLNRARQNNNKTCN